ncbi:MAG: hypothetical protein D6815_03745 [Candidatus Dadabacteria bacterium]|nr:MAG: hypothetical protein D6815_03745 [Candidatus Dadabacteria bacterium]
MAGQAGADARRQPRWIDYVAIARPEHWVKHVFILPGLVLAYVVHPDAGAHVARSLVLGLIAAGLLASANYVVNEALDATFDAYHPEKANRPAVTTRLSPRVVMVEYALLSSLGLFLAMRLGALFGWTGVLFLASGLAYNVRPLRLKDQPFLDVLSEAVNNPIRLTFGWSMVSPSTIPPSSLLLAFWMGGAFLMAVKRFAEYRAVVADVGREQLVCYRRSFRGYSEESLLVSAFLYAMMSGFFLAVFLVKYRVEYVLALPFVAALFAVYLRVGLKKRSRAQAPERLLQERTLVAVVAVLVFVFLLLTFVDLPFVSQLSDPYLIPVPGAGPA